MYLSTFLGVRILVDKIKVEQGSPSVGVEEVSPSVRDEYDLPSVVAEQELAFVYG